MAEDFINMFFKDFITKINFYDQLTTNLQYERKDKKIMFTDTIKGCEFDPNTTKALYAINMVEQRNFAVTNNLLENISNLHKIDDAFIIEKITALFDFAKETDSTALTRLYTLNIEKNLNLMVLWFCTQ